MAVTYEINLINLIQKFGDDESCRDYLESLRWPDGVTCPDCKSKSVSEVPSRSKFICNTCRHQFSVTSGTIMHDTHLPLTKWFLALYMILESKKSVSANQISRKLDIAYRTSWYLCHRIRKALFTPHALMAGVVEVDETWIGGKATGRGKGYKKNKAIVAGACERGGDVRMDKVGGIDRTTLRNFIDKHIAENARALFTDENPAYKGMAGTDHRRHEWVTHSAEEYVRGDVHTNNIEGAWNLFKRCIVGAYHKISHKHLDLYLDEFEFRFNNRENPYIFRDALKELMTADCLRYAELVA